MGLSEELKQNLLKEIEKAKMHFIESAKIVAEECSEKEVKLYRQCSEEPAQKLQDLINYLNN